MMRLIDADEMINGWIDGINEPIYCANDVLDDIDKQPTVDAVEAVRCKDCEGRQRQYRRSSLIIALDIIGSVQDFGEMVENHADESWTGEEIVQALAHRGLYHPTEIRGGQNDK